MSSHKNFSCHKDNQQKIHFITLGCPRNTVDSEIMLGTLIKHGYQPTLTLQEADFIIINTCGFLKSGREEGSTLVNEVHKKKKPNAKIILCGCMIQREGKKIFDRFDNVHYFVSSGHLPSILQAVQSTKRGIALSSQKSYLEQKNDTRILSTYPTYAYLKIAEGCRKQCTFCAIPYIKGPLKSKTPEQIKQEFNALLDMGIQEINLIAQDLGDWGKDLPDRPSLVSLLQQLLDDPRDFWIRLLYLYPDTLHYDLFSLMQKDPRICPYLDIPLQHVNDTILKSMRRKTTKKDIVDIITYIRNHLPNLSIRSTFIVGFPGETEEQFLELKNFLQSHPLDNVGIFAYSQEEKTKAFSLPNQISEEIKTKRHNLLMQQQKKIVRTLNQKMIGKTISVLPERYYQKDQQWIIEGRSPYQAPEVDGITIIKHKHSLDHLPNKLKAKVVKVVDYDLICELV